MRIRRYGKIEPQQSQTPLHVGMRLVRVPPPRPSLARVLALALSALLCILAAACYAFRPDSVAAVTVFPAWAWLLPGSLLLALGVSRRTRALALFTLLLWAAFTGVFVEESRSLLRTGQWPADTWEIARARGQAMRVVSLNCAGASADVAMEVEPYHPDIVLLQEATGPVDLEAIARRLFGHHAAVVHGADAAILAHGTLSEHRLPEKARGFAVAADVRLSSGAKATVVSLRLWPPVARWDLWSPSCWVEQARNRGTHRTEMQVLLPAIDRLPPDSPVIVGGDFNAPHGDPAPRLLAPRLHDTFAEAGRGWGDTGMNDFPALRVDQVWASDRFRAGAVTARPTHTSDHRLVLCDLWLREPAFR